MTARAATQIAIRGIDFTSAPSRRKPLTCVTATASGTGDGLTALDVKSLDRWSAFADPEAALAQPGPWVAGFDFPFGQARRFVENIGWPASWAGYVRHVAGMDRAAFRRALDEYRRHRDPGDREHRRAMDVATGAISPQKLHGVPVALMFFEGAPRLRAAGVTIPGLLDGDPDRICVEAYPGTLARRLIGRRSYKTEDRRKQTDTLTAARADILAGLAGDPFTSAYGLTVALPPDLAATMRDDPSGDSLDALLCAVQAAWAWRHRDRDWGAPPGFDPLEGWIADPVCGGG
ncbi:DUF429 domain-containing protein [Marinibaculum pumilum]|uniref:DUF429 domain-containing protein n=1 Tax=Marinibaculum pumilum TaxID=1766165 RepID=A0ABV7L134_9PROT